MDIKVKPVPLDEITDVVKVHQSAFENFFLTQLGAGFLSQYYKSIVKSNDGILIGAYLENKLIGFGAICFKSAGFNSRLIKNNLSGFVPIGLKLLFFKPTALYRLFMNLTKKGNTSDEGDYAELLSIAVKNDIQNSGAGKAIINYLEAILRNKNICRLSLTTDTHENENTLNFYKKCGFEVLYQFETYPKRTMYRLIKEL